MQHCFRCLHTLQGFESRAAIKTEYMRKKEIGKIINGIIICHVFLFCCTICIGQNDNILLKYSLVKKEYHKKDIWKGLLFPIESIQNHDYQRIINYDTSFSKLDTLFVVLPDNRKHLTTQGEKYGCVDLTGIHPLKKVFFQSVPIQTEKRIVVLKCNWFTFIFERKKENKYKLKKVDKEGYYDYMNKLVEDY